MVDYSKWKEIEISDDEDQTHVNIDTASLFRWRHKARIERMQEQNKALAEYAEKRTQLTAKLAQADLGEEERKALEGELSELDRKEEDLKKRQKRQAWNVDTIGQPTWSSTVLNKKCLSNSSNATEVPDYETDKAALSGYDEHIRKYEEDIRQFAFHADFEDCRRYLVAHPNIVHQYTLDYLSLWCMQLQLEDKIALLEHVSRQAVILQMILDLAKTVGGGIDPRSCLSVFFERGGRAQEKFNNVFNEELADFRERVKKAAQHRIDRAIAEQASNPEQLIGPGGLNAQEVFESLPEELQKCFESRSHEQIQRVLASMKPEEAEYHMKRCIDAGLWSTERVEDEDEQMLAALAAKADKEVASAEQQSESSEDSEM